MAVLELEFNLILLLGWLMYCLLGSKPIVDWERAFRAVARAEAVKRLIDASPRATVCM